MTAQIVEPVDFSVSEWQRLDAITNRYEHWMKKAYLQTVVQGNSENSQLIGEVVTDCVLETAISTANVYGLRYNPNLPQLGNLIASLTDNCMKVVNNETAKDKVKAILPNDISLTDRNTRLDVFGLSGRDAVRLERMRQKGSSRNRLEDARLHMSVQRGNLISLTEINRIVNATLETLWGFNHQVSKAKSSEWFLESDGRVSNITSLHGIPSRARKTIVTRRDNRTCDYCLPLEGVKAKVGLKFNTMYGLFLYPPFHPRCRCYMIVSF